MLEDIEQQPTDGEVRVSLLSGEKFSSLALSLAFETLADPMSVDSTVGFFMEEEDRTGAEVYRSGDNGYVNNCYIGAQYDEQSDILTIEVSRIDAVVKRYKELDPYNQAYLIRSHLGKLTTQIKISDIIEGSSRSTPLISLSLDVSMDGEKAIPILRVENQHWNDFIHSGVLLAPIQFPRDQGQGKYLINPSYEKNGMTWSYKRRFFISNVMMNINNLASRRDVIFNLRRDLRTSSSSGHDFGNRYWLNYERVIFYVRKKSAHSEVSSVEIDSSATGDTNEESYDFSLTASIGSETIRINGQNYGFSFSTNDDIEIVSVVGYLKL